MFMDVFCFSSRKLKSAQRDAKPARWL